VFSVTSQYKDIGIDEINLMCRMKQYENKIFELYSNTCGNSMMFFIDDNR